MTHYALAICGWKNSGKTTLIEALIPRLTAEGLTVAVVKNDVHGLNIDREGKDSDRFFQAGADVFLQGPVQEFRRRRSEAVHFGSQLAEAHSRYDVVLVEGNKGTDLPKVWLDKGDGEPPPEQCGEILLTLPFSDGRLDAVMELLMGRLREGLAADRPLGCVLIGGASRRMGQPKHLAEQGGVSWIERTVDRMRDVAADVVIAGSGALPESLAETKRLPDIPGAKGPIAGILSAMRWNRSASWLVAACDMPDLSVDAFEWILSRRRLGCRAVLPRVPADGKPDGEGTVQPLLAYYDFRARPLLERIVRAGDFSLLRLLDDSRVLTPDAPPEIMGAWRNINSPEELRQYERSFENDR